MASIDVQNQPFVPTTTRSLGAVFECVVAETLGADVLAVSAFVAERALRQIELEAYAVAVGCHGVAAFPNHLLGQVPFCVSFGFAFTFVFALPSFLFGWGPFSCCCGL